MKSGTVKLSKNGYCALADNKMQNTNSAYERHTNTQAGALPLIGGTNVNQFGITGYNVSRADHRQCGNG